MADKDWTTAAELAREWGVSRQWIGKLVKTGRIPSTLRFGRRLIRRDVTRPDALKPGRNVDR